MGNHGSIHVCLDQEVFQAGHPLTGRVVLRVNRPFRKPFRNGGTLALLIHGKEKAATTNSLRRTKDLSPKRKGKRAERQFFRVDLPLKTFSSRIRRGSYSFPFQVNLPASLPSSTRYPFNTKTPESKGFRIQYKIQAAIGTLLDECYVMVASAPLPAEPVSRLVEPTHYSLKAARFFHKGTVLLGARVANSNIGRGQDLELHLACRNQSTVEIRRVEIKLVECLSWSSTLLLEQSGYLQKATETLLELKDIDLPSLDRSRRSRFDVRRKTSSDSAFMRRSTRTEYQEIFDQLMVSGRGSSIALRVPSQARDTYSGQIVRISHFLEIKFQTGRMISNPVTRIPIRIGNAPAVLRRPTTPAVPANPQSPPVIQECIDNNAPALVHPYVRVPPACEPSVRILEPGQQQQEQQDYAIPLVAAVSAVLDDTMQASMTVANEDVIVLGGDAIIIQDYYHEEPFSSAAITDLDRLVPVPPPSNDDLPEAALERLLREMSRSVDDYDMLVKKLEDPGWRQLFNNLTPEEYGMIVSKVSDQFDQPRVAALLAPFIDGEGRSGLFTCKFAASAVRNATEWNRSTVAQHLLPLCVDLPTNYHLIQNELNEWDQVVTESDFQGAIANAERHSR